MKFIAIAAGLAACASTAAAAALSRTCLTPKEANVLVARFATLHAGTDSDLGNATATSNVIIADIYAELSDSVNTLAGLPLGGFSSNGTRVEYITSLGYTPPVSGVQTLKVYVAGCRQVLWQWQFNGVGSSQYPVKGFNLFHLNKQNQIKQTDIEFNSIAWGHDIFALPCNVTTSS